MIWQQQMPSKQVRYTLMIIKSLFQICKKILLRGTNNTEDEKTAEEKELKN